MFRQRWPSHDCHVHVVAPGVWPGTACAVTPTGPTRTVSPSLTVRTCSTFGK